MRKSAWLTAGFFATVGLLGWQWGRRWRRTETEVSQLDSPQFVQVAGFRLHYVQRGRGHDLVLLHGLGGSVYCWREVYSLLAQRFRVTAYDLPGFGHSDKPADVAYGLDEQTDRMIEAIDRLGIAKPYLAGHSLGAAVALWLAHRQPQRFAKVAILCPGIGRSLLPVALHRVALAAPVVYPLLNERSAGFLLRHLVKHRERITPRVAAQYLAPYQGDPRGLVAFGRAMQIVRDRRLMNELKDLSSELLLVSGKRDRVVTPKSVEKIRASLPPCELAELPGGHLVMTDHPTEVAELLTRFFAAESPRSCESGKAEGSV